MKYTRLFFYSLLTASLLVSCKGEDGEPGPQGDAGLQGNSGTILSKSGSIQGTITGTRRDGVALNESFTYEFTYQALEGISFNSNEETYDLGIQRTTETETGYIYLGFDVEEKGTPNERLIGDNFEFSFIKELSETSLLSVYTEEYNFGDDQSYLTALSRSENETYLFQTYGDDRIDYNFSYYDNELESYFYGFSTIDGSVVYYENNNYRYDETNDFYYGEFYRIVDADGNESFTSALYSQLIYSQNEDGDAIFRNSSTGEDLSETIEILNSFEVSNYTYDSATGKMTFDFAVVIDAEADDNSTGNDLTISGTFNSGDGKVYADVVGRNRN